MHRVKIHFIYNLAFILIFLEIKMLHLKSDFFFFSNYETG